MRALCRTQSRVPPPCATPLPYPCDVSESDQSGSQRIERVLAYMFTTMVMLSVAAFIAVLIGTMAGVAENDGFSQGVWPVVIMLPWFGLPIGFLLLIALFIVHAVNRSRSTRPRTN